MSLLDHYDEIAQCNKCGFCQAACPIFRATGHEIGVARGRLALLRALIEKRVDWSRELEEPLFSCLRCGACTSNCFPGVATADLLAEARSEYLENVGRSALHRVLFDLLLPNPPRLRLAVKAAAFGKSTGLSRAVRALRMLRGFGHMVRDLPRAEEIVERFPSRAFRDTVPPGVREGQGGKLRIGYFVGCGIDLVCPEAADATLEILCRLGKTVHILDNCCCGVPAHTYGDDRATRKLAEKNLKLIDPGEFDVIVTDCSSCAAFLKKYPSLFAENDPLREKAEQLASGIRDLLEMLPSSEAKPVDLPEPAIATYHDPCHASRGQNLVGEPREVLRSIPGIEYRELPEADWCCGGAGSYALGHYDLSMQVLDRKIDNVEKTGANLLVTSCPACMIQLSYGLRRRGLAVRVCHIGQLVSQPKPEPAGPSHL